MCCGFVWASSQWRRRGSLWVRVESFASQLNQELSWIDSLTCWSTFSIQGELFIILQEFASGSLFGLALRPENHTALLQDMQIFGHSLLDPLMIRSARPNVSVAVLSESTEIVIAEFTLGPSGAHCQSHLQLG